MIRRLRWRFILINLLLVGLVLTVVFVLLLISNAHRLEDQTLVPSIWGSAVRLERTLPVSRSVYPIWREATGTMSATPP